MKPEEYTTFRDDIDAIYSDFIRVQSLFVMITGEMNASGIPTAQGVDALTAATDYLERVMNDFAAIMDPIPSLGKEVPA